MKRFNRREFLHLSSAALGGMVFSRLSCGERQVTKPGKVGLQLYSVRDVFEKEPAGTIRALASLGYKELESYERNEDMFWGMNNKGFRKLVDELGISLVSSHCDPQKNFEAKVEQAAEIGMKYLVYNWPFNQVTLDEYRKKADLFNAWGERCKKAGIRFGYHNYSSSYEQLEGIYPQDLLMQRTDPSLVQHQMDVYWVWRAGQDPAAWIRKYPNRYTSCHVKDGDKKETCELGKGQVDLRSFLKEASRNGMENYFIEQEDYRGSGSMEAARKNLEWIMEG